MLNISCCKECQLKFICIEDVEFGDDVCNETRQNIEVLTIEKLIELEKWLRDHSVEPWNGVVFLSKDQWLYARQNGQCDFTDDELNAAVNKSGVIKIGHLKGYGNVHMAIKSRGNNVPA